MQEKRSLFKQMSWWWGEKQEQIEFPSTKHPRQFRLQNCWWQNWPDNKPWSHRSYTGKWLMWRRICWRHRRGQLFIYSQKLWWY